MHVENKKKKITKLSVVSNEHKFIHSIVPFNVNTKHQKYSTSVHDVKMITDSIVNIVIDSYRCPIERNISAFFQNIELTVNTNLNEININMLVYWFNKYHIDCDNYHPLDEINNIFTETDFDFKNEYLKKQIHNNIYIKLRFKSIHIWDKILSQIFNKAINITSDNMSVDKKYHDIYVEFKNHYKVPRDYLLNIQAYPTFAKYNSLLEKDEYIKYWTLKSCDNDDFLRNITDDSFQNIPNDFDINAYKQLNSTLCDYSDINAKIHYELLGYYNKLMYK